MFPFRGMPVWAQVIGEVAAAHAFSARRPRGIMLKGAPFSSISAELGAILLFFVVVAAITLLRFRRTLD